MSDVREVAIGFLGCGNIGGGVWRLIQKTAGEIEKREGVRLNVKKILVRDASRARDTVPMDLLTANPDDVIDNPDIQIVAEFMGGAEPAGTYMERALKAGKAVVTANKMALALGWNRLNAASVQSGAGLYYEASVGGGIPIIRAVKASLQANDFCRVLGIINGTTNYILTQMSKDGVDYAPALSEAQRLGLAEPDPTADVSGMDAVYKLSILATLAFRARMPFGGIYHDGITRISAEDIEAGKRMGYTIKLLAIAKRTSAGIEARVHPAFIPSGHPLAAVSGSYNAIFLTGDAVEDMMFYGRGAGDMPTASAVVSDVINAAKALGASEELGADYAEAAISGDFRSRYYIRMTARGSADVSQLINAFTTCGIEIASFNREGETATITTYETSEHALQSALSGVLPDTAEVSSVIRIEELE